MITFDKAIKICQDEAKDYSSDSLIIIKDDLNLGYKYVLSELGRSFTERTRTANTVANQQYYQTPKDFLFPKSVTVKIGTITYPVTFEESQVRWDRMNAYPQSVNIPQCAFVRRSFGVNVQEIGFFPTPSTAGSVIGLVYEAGDKDCTTLSYVTGTVQVSNGSATVTGTGTSFSTVMVGRWFSATAPAGDGLWYRVQSADSPTQITLDQAYAGFSQGGLSYQVSEAFNLPEELQILPCHFFLQHYFSIKGNEASELKNKQLLEDGILKGQKRYANKGKSAVMNQRSMDWNVSTDPPWFPQAITA